MVNITIVYLNKMQIFFKDNVRISPNKERSECVDKLSHHARLFVNVNKKMHKPVIKHKKAGILASLHTYLVI
jgi:hypothetical protein